MYIVKYFEFLTQNLHKNSVEFALMRNIRTKIQIKIFFIPQILL